MNLSSYIRKQKVYREKKEKKRKKSRHTFIAQDAQSTFTRTSLHTTCVPQYFIGVSINACLQDFHRGFHTMWGMGGRGAERVPYCQTISAVRRHFGVFFSIYTDVGDTPYIAVCSKCLGGLHATRRFRTQPQNKRGGVPVVRNLYLRVCRHTPILTLPVC